MPAIRCGKCLAPSGVGTDTSATPTVFCSHCGHQVSDPSLQIAINKFSLPPNGGAPKGTIK